MGSRLDIGQLQTIKFIFNGLTPLVLLVLIFKKESVSQAMIRKVHSFRFKRQKSIWTFLFLIRHGFIIFIYPNMVMYEEDK